MAKRRVSKRLRRRLAEAAKRCCGYCLTSELTSGAALEVDHLVPESKGGASDEENLWLVCRQCNSHKADRLTARDPTTAIMTRLFDPRRQQWADHFRWLEQGAVIEGLTPIGRATIEALQLNRDRLVAARRVWISAGVHPP
jgi:hypothetical protein